MLGNCKRNKWCCFCSNWFDPACSALKPLKARDLFEVDQTVVCKCRQNNLNTKALATCPKFKPKF